MKYSRLVAFGCSLTYGHGLPDCYSGSNKKESGVAPSKFAWPSLLADRLNLPCLNLSVSGASNKRICYTICNTDLRPGDLVFINWTFTDRSCIIKEHEIIDLNRQGKRNITNGRYKKFSDPHDRLVSSNLKAMLTRAFLENKSIKNFHMVSDPKDFLLNKENETFFLKSTIKEFQNVSKGLDNLHPGHISHLKFSEKIYNEVKDVL